MATDLITKTEYKNYLGIQSSNKDDEIELLIPKVSSLVKTYCRRTFIDYYDQPILETFEGGFTNLMLKESPVVNIVFVRRSIDYGKTYTNLVEYTDWVQDGDSIRCLNVPLFAPLIRGYQVSYLAGFEAVPDDLKLAIMDLVEYYSKNNSAVHVNRDVTPNVTQIQYVQSTAFPAHIKRVLDQYVADYT